MTVRTVIVGELGKGRSSVGESLAARLSMRGSDEGTLCHLTSRYPHGSGPLFPKSKETDHD